MPTKPVQTPDPAKSLDARPQTVLVLQGGGALGAYQLGVFQALHERGVEPDWVIGTSIGAINAALIAGNPRSLRLERMAAFWQRIEQHGNDLAHWFDASLGQTLANVGTITQGVDGFFSPRPAAWWSPQLPVGVEQASYYSTQPLRETLAELLDQALLGEPEIRITVGAVGVASGKMHYFDSRAPGTRLQIDHIVASGALPPAFGAVRVGGEAFWDGGIFSNTPIEAVFDDHPRRNSLIFSVSVWHQQGPEPSSINEVLARQKDIQYASRHEGQIAQQKQIHHLRHVIRALSQQLDAPTARTPAVRELAGWGCGTTMHVAHLEAPRLSAEDASKDIDFSANGIRLRSEAGRRDTLEMLDRADWLKPHDPLAGVIEHHLMRNQT
ncbi:MAG: patatin-like phospholipase family protein [Ideonella sp.]